LSRSCSHGTWGTGSAVCPLQNNSSSSSNRLLSACIPCTMLRNWAMVKCTFLYSSSSLPIHSTFPRAVVLKCTFSPYVRKSSIHCIGLWLPRTINLSIICCTNSKQPFG
jgi:hypothetical protein